MEFPDAADIEGVLETLDRAVETARVEEGRWGLFAALYREVTRAVAVGIDAGRFEDGPRMSRFDAAFANRYFAALRRVRAGEEPGKSWGVALNASGDSELTALAHILLGVNAHINLDLGLAVVEAGLDPFAFRADFDEINRILAEVLTRAQSDLNAFSPAMDRLDELLGDADEFLGLFILARARDQAWRTAVVADAIPITARPTLETVLDRATAHLGRRIASPSLPIAAALALVRRHESWTPSELMTAMDSHVDR